jgi:hypothetical protein
MKQHLLEAAKTLLTEMGAQWESPLGGMKFVELNDAIWKMAGLLATDGNTENMILALDEYDQEGMRTVGNFSNLAAVSADHDDYALARTRGLSGQDAKDFAEKRHQRRTLEALDEMTLPFPISARVRQMTIETLLGRNVRLGSPPYCLRVASHIANLIKSKRVFQSVAVRKPEQGRINQPHASKVEEELAACGV